jgi:hypothetical protein
MVNPNDIHITIFTIIGNDLCILCDFSSEKIKWRALNWVTHSLLCECLFRLIYIDIYQNPYYFDGKL